PPEGGTQENGLVPIVPGLASHDCAYKRDDKCRKPEVFFLQSCLSEFPYRERVRCENVRTKHSSHQKTDDKHENRKLSSAEFFHFQKSIYFGD
ncbi:MULTISPECIES: hypothetical protein, partial [unclassified Pseudomonas]